jgi:hypothetical protein
VEKLDVHKAMKVIEGIKLRGKPAEIPDCSRDDLPEFFVEMGYKVGVEIGVDKGEFSQKFAQKGLTLYAVDPWKSYPDYEDSRGQERLEFLYKNVTILRKNSMEAAADFEDESLDFVYIDGNHQFRYIAEDLCEWSKKIKKGGSISGHDYIYTNPKTPAGICHVIYVVNAYTTAYKINNWFLLGRKDRLINEKRDRFRSFLWIK